MTLPLKVLPKKFPQVCSVCRRAVLTDPCRRCREHGLPSDGLKQLHRCYHAVTRNPLDDPLWEPRIQGKEREAERNRIAYIIKAYDRLLEENGGAEEDEGTSWADKEMNIVPTGFRQSGLRTERDLVQRLRRLGCIPTRHKGSHQTWTAPKGTQFTITIHESGRVVSRGVLLHVRKALHVEGITL